MKSFGFQWHLTHRCNSRCVHCYQDDFSSNEDLPLGSVLQVASRILAALPGVPVSINLTGGEPLLWPHLMPLLEHLHGYPNFAEAHIITNGALADEALLDDLAAWERLGLFKMSVESGIEDVNDAVRGHGSLHRILRNLPLYLRRRPVVWMMTLGTHNSSTIARTVALARESGVSGVIFERFVPLGQSSKARHLVLDAQGWKAAVLDILEEAGVDAEFEDVTPFRAFWLRTEPGCEEPLQGALCNLGDESMALMPDATVFPCRRLPLEVGHVLREPFEDILFRLKDYHVNTIRKKLHGERCGRCAVEDCCGCRALAFAMSGDLFLDDPQCAHALDAF
jgi:radical SAM protein with 4Fe4S-binding SPASM domain